VYRVTRCFPREELYALGDQLRRSAGSVPMNIAEGYRRPPGPDKIRFFNYAQTSLDEADYQLLTNDLGYADTADLQKTADEIARMLNVYIRRLREP
jgi:four helix bundle protein